ncbi:MAG: histidine phosphatase family protein [Neofamilia sp.]
MNIYLTRHSQTEWNLVRRIQGFLDSPLTEKGIEDAKKLRDRLKDVDIDVAYTSTQGRAVKTAEIVMEGKRGKLIESEVLRELGVGTWQGMYYEDIIKNHPEQFELYTTKPHVYKPDNGGETYPEFEKRVRGFIDYIKKQPYENILIVTHGLTYMMLLNLFEEKPLKNLTDRKVPLGTALAKIKYEDGKFEILYEGDDKHLF